MHRKLVAMANQIGEFFRYQGDEDSAMQSIAAHLHHYWAPSMRRDLVAWLDQNEGEGMYPLVKACVITYRDKLVNRLAHAPGETEIRQARGGG